MNILLLTVSAGGGHIKAAEAIKETFQIKYPDTNLMIVDTYKYVNPLVDKIIVGGYLNTIRNTPNIYGKLYSLSEPKESRYDFGKTINKVLALSFKKLISDFNPAVIACTNFIPLQILANIYRKEDIGIPTVSIITDYTTHSYWLHEYVDAYVVANELLKWELIKKGIHEKSIHPYGIPVISSFLKNKDKKKLLRELKLEDKLTILIMGGTLGFGQLKKTFLSLLNYSQDIQIVVITGKNISLKIQLEEYSKQSEKRIKIVGYTNRVSDFMDVSDFIITKPGGMTIAEALVKELPILIISPIPGQEERNARFLVNHGAAVRLTPDDDINVVLQQITNNPLRIQQMKDMERFLAKPDAACNTADFLHTLAQTQVEIGIKKLMPSVCD